MRSSSSSQRSKRAGALAVVLLCLPNPKAPVQHSFDPRQRCATLPTATHRCLLLRLCVSQVTVTNCTPAGSMQPCCSCSCCCCECCGCCWLPPGGDPSPASAATAAAAAGDAILFADAGEVLFAAAGEVCGEPNSGPEPCRCCWWWCVARPDGRHWRCCCSCCFSACTRRRRCTSAALSSYLRCVQSRGCASHHT
jgi:hypothetical protein